MLQQHQPLADRLRPQKLKDYVGQSHLVSQGKPIRLAIESGNVHSMIFWGPPGTGKTTLARVIAHEIEATFHELSAVSAGKADVRKIVEMARDPLFSPKTVLFLDEIHRFNKAQQDFLLPYVEDGTINLIGATTENPSFEVISALLSRSQVYVLNQLTKDELKQILQAGLKELNIKLDKQGTDFILEYANGDARTLLNVLETSSRLKFFEAGAGILPAPKNSKTKKTLTKENLKNTLQSKHLRYDTKGEEHYNTISSYIKSMRASDPDAALYYLARMVESGEDPKFIARRMVIFASEDIGMAQPTALVVANEVFRAVEVIGYPECAINLAHGTVYMCLSKKDRGSYEAYFKAVEDVKQHGNLPIPMHLRNAPTKLMKELGYGKGYEKYPNKEKSLLPEKLKNKKYYYSK